MPRAVSKRDIIGRAFSIIVTDTRTAELEGLTDRAALLRILSISLEAAYPTELKAARRLVTRTIFRGLT